MRQKICLKKAQISLSLIVYEPVLERNNHAKFGNLQICKFAHKFIQPRGGVPRAFRTVQGGVPSIVTRSAANQPNICQMCGCNVPKVCLEGMINIIKLFPLPIQLSHMFVTLALVRRGRVGVTESILGALLALL